MNTSEFAKYSDCHFEALDAFAKTQQHLSRCKKALCSISGGSDSDVMLDIVHKADNEQKVSYVFFDTGFEYEATRKHLEYLEKKYNIEIKSYKAKTPIPLACKKHGQPFISKFVSEMIQRLQRHGFKWEDKPFETLIEEYPKCKVALKWWCNLHGEKSKFNINRHKFLKEFMIENPPSFLISNKCCDYAKKKVAKEANENENCDLVIMGVRKSEGGIRSAAYKSCFSEASISKVANYRPIFWFTDANKTEYENCTQNIKHSDCYTVYGLKRTGCAGCPFGKDFENELAIIEKYEPKLYKAVNKVFGASYDYTRKYKAFREQKKTA